MTTYAYLGACAVLLYTSFCRMVHTHADTLIPVRLAFVLLAFSASLAIASVLVWGYAPDWPSTVAFWAFALVQVVSSRVWKYGVPNVYQGRGVHDRPSEHRFSGWPV